MKTEKFYPWQCPNCGEVLSDPLYVASTQCHCGQGVSLGDVMEDGRRYVLAREIQEPILIERDRSGDICRSGGRK